MSWQVYMLPYQMKQWIMKRSGNSQDEANSSGEDPHLTTRHYTIEIALVSMLKKQILLLQWAQ